MKPLSSSPQLLNCASAYLHCTYLPYLAASLVPNIFEGHQVSASLLRTKMCQISSSHSTSPRERSRNCIHPLFL
ncbi:hypothetical protein HanXRQr2_Chr12g0537511 [Helianthus annuus]|uniref:Uncharacterized protein n=1 Tax=Helianthus annuus TaxID=4232 RepID=A0A9K3MVS9_HELAN|nr:hypothetical protein HanXRQr2_Chr12g0537511 [Helianthus annuus]